MTIPLIQRDGPFQQLQQAVQSVMAQRQQRQAEALQMLLGQTQLQQAQGQVAMQPLQQEQMRASTDASRANTASTTAETNRAQSLYDKTQKQEKEVADALALVRGTQPGTPQYNAALHAASAALGSPEQIARLQQGLVKDEENRTFAARAAAATLERTLQQTANEEIQTQLAQDPAFRRQWALLGNDNWTRMEVARMQRASQGASENAQADMLTRQLVMGTFSDARERFRAAQAAYAGTGQGGRSQPFWFYQPNGRAVYIDPNAVSDLTPFRPVEQNYITGAVEALSQSLGIPRAQVETMVRNWVTRPRSR
jgi:hypothetical protein